jgi:DNA-binding NtrC family response regulator
MTSILLCSSNPILIKSLYGVLRDEGYNVETVEHPSLAVKKVLTVHYDFVIVDSEPFGLSAEDAAQIISSVAADTPVVVLDGGRRAGQPLDLAELTRTIHSIAV